jgi:hypothetical protein
MKIIKYLRLILLLMMLLGLNFSSISAQTYSFEVTQSVVNVYINSDGTLSIEYNLQFKNDASASPIDYVDIGLPNKNYDNANVTAYVDGIQLSDIAASTYVDPGVAVGLGANAIQPGQSGKLYVLINNVAKTLYPGTQKEVEDYASLEFSPNWFGSQYCHGPTNMTFTLILPPGVKPEEPRYYPPKSWPGAAEPATGLDDKGRVYYSWQSADANSHTQYTFGTSFPARIVPSDTIVRPNPFAFLAGIVTWVAENFCFASVCLLIAGSWIWGIYQGTVGAQKRKLQYFPPKISIEGHGVKRGLTAVETAILMEQPLDRVLTMILFAVIKKNAARVVTKDPLKIEAISPTPEDLRGYETDFLQAMSAPTKVAQREGLQDLMVKLVKSVSEKMKGFSRKESLDYYKNIMEKAWTYVEAAETPEVKMQKYDEVMDWTMLDSKYGERTTETFRTGPVFLPGWWGNYDPTFHSGHSGGLSAGSSPVSSGGLPSLSMPNLPGSDFAASVVRGAQNFSSNVIGDVGAFTGGITNKTNPVPVSSSSGSHRSGGGGGCACACACAGCACACAGGGR